METTKVTPLPGLLSWDEACALLGYKTRHRLSQAVRNREIEYVQLSGRRVAFTRAGLEAFIARRTQGVAA